MKIIVASLGLLIGVLMGLIFYLSSKYFVAHVKYPHIQIIENKSNETIKYLCFNNVGYLIVTTYGTAITMAKDTENKPLRCKF